MNQIFDLFQQNLPPSVSHKGREQLFLYLQALWTAPIPDKTRVLLTVMEYEHKLLSQFTVLLWAERLHMPPKDIPSLLSWLQATDHFLKSKRSTLYPTFLWYSEMLILSLGARGGLSERQKQELLTGVTTRFSKLRWRNGVIGKDYRVTTTDLPGSTFEIALSAQGVYEVKVDEVKRHTSLEVEESLQFLKLSIFEHMQELASSFN